MGVPAEAQAAGFHIERGERVFELGAEIRSLRIVNPHGDLRVRRGRDDSFGFSYTAQRLAPEWRQPEFVVERSAERLSVAVRYAEPAPEALQRFGRIGRLDMVAFVPESVLLDVETDDGALLIRHRIGPVRARSAEGRVQASSDTALHLIAGNGPMLGRLTGRATLQDSHFEQSGKGPVDLLLPRSTPYSLDVMADGGISSGSGWYPGEGFQLEPSATRLVYRVDQPLPRITVRSAGAVSLGVIAELSEVGADEDDL